MIWLGLDDTDVVGTAGTNQLARAILRRLGHDASGAIVCRHQLLDDPRVPYTSKNGSASIQLPSVGADDTARLLGVVRGLMRAWFIPGSDPGLCVAATAVPASIQAFGRVCQQQVMTKAAAWSIARDNGVHLEGLGGSEQGVIGALAAVGLSATGDDGRVVQMDGWTWPDDFRGARAVGELRARGVQSVRRRDTGEEIAAGVIDIGHHLRPNIRGGKVVLFVEPATDSADPAWRAVKVP